MHIPRKRERGGVIFCFLYPQGPRMASPGITRLTSETSPLYNSFLEEGPELWNSVSLVGLSPPDCLLSNYKRNW